MKKIQIRLFGFNLLSFNQTEESILRLKIELLRKSMLAGLFCLILLLSLNYFWVIGSPTKLLLFFSIIEIILFTTWAIFKKSGYLGGYFQKFLILAFGITLVSFLFNNSRVDLLNWDNGFSIYTALSLISLLYISKTVVSKKLFKAAMYTFTALVLARFLLDLYALTKYFFDNNRQITLDKLTFEIYFAVIYSCYFILKAKFNTYLRLCVSILLWVGLFLFALSLDGTKLWISVVGFIASFSVFVFEAKDSIIKFFVDFNIQLKKRENVKALVIDGALLIVSLIFLLFGAYLVVQQLKLYVLTSSISTMLHVFDNLIVSFFITGKQYFDSPVIFSSVINNLGLLAGFMFLASIFGALYYYIRNYSKRWVEMFLFLLIIMLSVFTVWNGLYLVILLLLTFDIFSNLNEKVPAVSKKGKK